MNENVRQQYYIGFLSPFFSLSPLLSVLSTMSHLWNFPWASWGLLSQPAVPPSELTGGGSTQALFRNSKGISLFIPCVQQKYRNAEKAYTSHGEENYLQPCTQW